MRIYHTTTQDAADAIHRDGFRDTSGSYGFAGVTLTGVFFSDVPVGVNEGAKGDPALGDPVLVLDIPEEEIAGYGWVDAITEWCIPAETANRFGPPEVLDAATVEEFMVRQYAPVVRRQRMHRPHDIAASTVAWTGFLTPRTSPITPRL